MATITGPPCRADADGAAPHPDADGHVGGVPQRHGGGAAAGPGVRGQGLPLPGPLAALPQEPLWSHAGLQAGRRATGEPSELPDPADWRCVASAGW